MKNGLSLFYHQGSSSIDFYKLRQNYYEFIKPDNYNMMMDAIMDGKYVNDSALAEVFVDYMWKWEKEPSNPIYEQIFNKLFAKKINFKYGFHPIEKVTPKFGQSDYYYAYPFNEVLAHLSYEQEKFLFPRMLAQGFSLDDLYFRPSDNGAYPGIETVTAQINDAINSNILYGNRIDEADRMLLFCYFKMGLNPEKARVSEGHPIYKEWSKHDKNNFIEIWKEYNKKQQPVSVKKPENSLFTNVANDMISVEGGTFSMGCTNEQGICNASEKPSHTVKLKSFYMNKYEVTVELYQSVMGNNPSELKTCPQCPVEGVNWNDAQTFIRKLNNLTGKKYRLPTEAEWEFAARGGNNTKGYKFSGSNNCNEVAWSSKNSNQDTLHEVGLKLPNELGLFDMNGNVEEWCSDWYNSDYYSLLVLDNPKGPKSGTDRIIRGGSVNVQHDIWNLSSRWWGEPGGKYNYHVGFRIACDN